MKKHWEPGSTLEIMKYLIIRTAFKAIYMFYAVNAAIDTYTLNSSKTK